MDYYIKSAKNHPSIIDAFLIIGYDSKTQILHPQQVV